MICMPLPNIKLFQNTMMKTKKSGCGTNEKDGENLLGEEDKHISTDFNSSRINLLHRGWKKLNQIKLSQTWWLLTDIKQMSSVFVDDVSVAHCCVLCVLCEKNVFLIAQIIILNDVYCQLKNYLDFYVVKWLVCEKPWYKSMWCKLAVI